MKNSLHKTMILYWKWSRQHLPFLIPAVRLLRDIKSTAKYIILEWPRGLNFSTRDKAACKDMNGVSEYWISSPARLKATFEALGSTTGRALLDVGCGKGFVLKLASELPIFSKLGGIEYDKKMAEICRKNLFRLGLNQVELFCEDARVFDKYADYDTFYFYNPFGPEIFEEVLRKIPSHNTTLIYYNPVCHQVILDSGKFQLKESLFADKSAYPTNIYIGVG